MTTMQMALRGQVVKSVQRDQPGQWGKENEFLCRVASAQSIWQLCSQIISCLCAMEEIPLFFLILKCRLTAALQYLRMSM